MIIAIASTRHPKSEAVKSAVSSFRHYLAPANEEIVFITREVDAGIVMPRSIAELLAGAYQRVVILGNHLKQENITAHYLVGLEGGFHTISSPINGRSPDTFLQSWACVGNGISTSFGSSGNIPVPAAIAREVYENHRELGLVIDEFASGRDIRSKQGTWGVLSRDLISRQRSFEAALVSAFAPFYNKEIY